MAGVLSQLQQGLPRLAKDPERIRSICAWFWIIGLNLNAKPKSGDGMSRKGAKKKQMPTSRHSPTG
jgi:hypothetical protein